MDWRPDQHDLLEMFPENFLYPWGQIAVFYFGYAIQSKIIGVGIIYSFCAILSFGAIAFMVMGCRTGRISGTYVSHGQNFVDMLQLTQTDNGQITGVFSSIELNSDGKIHSDSAPIASGAFDDGQLTLNFHPGIFGTSISGTKRWNTIRFETVGSSGDISSSEFRRSSSEKFQKYVGQLRFRAKGLSMSLDLSNGARGLRQAIQNAEQWIPNAEMHAQRIPLGKKLYERIDDKMQSLIARERAIGSSVARGQIAAVVSQGEAAGSQMDSQENQTWDDSIGPTGARISQKLATGVTLCKQGEKFSPKELQMEGTSREAIETWASTCRDAEAEQTKYGPIYQRIMEQRADLKSFQISEQSRREALVDAANRLE